MSERGLLFFMKYPEKGQVKTRLAEELGEDFTLKLYSRFVVDILELCADIDADFMIAYSTTDSGKDKKLFWGDQFASFCQKGDNIGTRMFNALDEASKRGCEKYVLIGSDCPDLPAAVIDEAYEMLGEFDVVLGPGTDGGYYLIGFTKDAIKKSIFDNVRWSSSKTLEDTLKNIEKSGLSNYLLPEWKDIDQLEDLKQFYNRYKYHRAMTSTMEFLVKNREYLSRFFNVQP